MNGPYCHGYEVRDQPLGVLGGSTEALAHTHVVRQWSDDVVYFANGQDLTAHQTLLTALGYTTRPNGWVATDPTARTSVHGAWTAGNAVNPAPGSSPRRVAP